MLRWMLGKYVVRMESGWDAEDPDCDNLESTHAWTKPRITSVKNFM
jgi:hypothetical protein